MNCLSARNPLQPNGAVFYHRQPFEDLAALLKGLGCNRQTYCPPLPPGKPMDQNPQSPSEGKRGLLPPIQATCCCLWQGLVILSQLVHSSRLTAALGRLSITHTSRLFQIHWFRRTASVPQWFLYSPEKKRKRFLRQLTDVQYALQQSGPPTDYSSHKTPA